MNGVAMLLSALERDPGDDAAWLALTDALEEQGDPGSLAQAEITRLSLRLRRDPENPEYPAWESRLQELVRAGARVCLPRRVVSLADGVELRLVLIPPGRFRMGTDPDRADERQHWVTLTRGFWMGVHPVTQVQWQTIMGENPSRFPGPQRPVERVSWSDCQAFCKKVKHQTGQPLRLPTEAEWEYACRAGTTTPFHFGETISIEIANYDATVAYGPGQEGPYREETVPVCSYPDNAWGLFDVHGSIYEWCRDWYRGYPKKDVTDPTGPRRGQLRVLRGGSWYAYPNGCRSAYRNHGGVAQRDGIAGFRVAADAG